MSSIRRMDRKANTRGFVRLILPGAKFPIYAKPVDRIVTHDGRSHLVFSVEPRQTKVVTKTLVGDRIVKTIRTREILPVTYIVPADAPLARLNGDVKVGKAA